MYQSVLSLRIRACFNMREILLLNTKKTWTTSQQPFPMVPSCTCHLVSAVKETSRMSAQLKIIMMTFIALEILKKKKKKPALSFLPCKSLYLRDKCGKS